MDIKRLALLASCLAPKALYAQAASTLGGRDYLLLAISAALLALVVVLALALFRQGRRIAGMAKALEEKVAERTAALEAAVKEQTELNARLAESNLHLQNAMDIQAKDTRVAVQVQQGLFPQRPPELPGWDLAFCSLPAAGVSGDFYDFYVEEGRLAGLVVGDVSGQGIASGLVTILARSAFWKGFRGLASHSLGRVLEEINSELSRDLSTVENFLTCIMLRLGDGAVEYANAAHPELAYRRSGVAKANYLVPKGVGDYKGPPIGREGIEAPFRAMKFGLEPGDSLLVYTDYLIDAHDDRGEAFGAENLLTSYGRAPEGSAQGMLDYILDDWRYHVGSSPLADDLTAVLLRRKP